MKILISVAFLCVTGMVIQDSFSADNDYGYLYDNMLEVLPDEV